MLNDQLVKVRMSDSGFRLTAPIETADELPKETDDISIRNSQRNRITPVISNLGK